MSKKLLYFVDIIIVTLLLLFDQFTKHLAITHLKGQPPISLIDNVLELQYLENRGVAFGMLQNQKTIILITGIFFIAIIAMVMLKTPMNRKFIVLHILLSFIIAGGIGNMIDRFSYSYVVDFISFVLIDFPIFNVADCYVVCATIIMFYLFMFVLKEEDLEFISFKKAKEN